MSLSKTRHKRQEPSSSDIKHFESATSSANAAPIVQDHNLAFTLAFTGLQISFYRDDELLPSFRQFSFHCCYDFPSSKWKIKAVRSSLLPPSSPDVITMLHPMRQLQGTAVTGLFPNCLFLDLSLHSSSLGSDLTTTLSFFVLFSLCPKNIPHSCFIPESRFIFSVYLFCFSYKLFACCGESVKSTRKKNRGVCSLMVHTACVCVTILGSAVPWHLLKATEVFAFFTQVGLCKQN